MGAKNVIIAVAVKKATIRLGLSEKVFSFVIN